MDTSSVYLPTLNEGDAPFQGDIEMMDSIHRMVFEALERHPDDPDLWVLMCWTAPSFIAASSYRESLLNRYPEYIPALVGLDLHRPEWDVLGDCDQSVITSTRPDLHENNQSNAGYGITQGPPVEHSVLALPAHHKTIEFSSKVVPASSVKEHSASGHGRSIGTEISPAHRKNIFRLLLTFIICLAAAEILITYNTPQAGMLLHGGLLICIFLYATFGIRGSAQKFIYTLALAPLIRLVSLSMPLAHFQFTYWYAIIGIPLLMSAYLVWRLTGYKRENIGLSKGHKWPLQIAVALSGIVLGYLEYQILKPEPLMKEFSLSQLWLPALILLIFTGFLEEFIFRGLMQEAAVPVLKRFGILYISLLFAVLHIGYKSMIDIAFVFIVGLFFALVVERTRSIAGVTLAHGLTNISLFLIIPYL